MAGGFIACEAASTDLKVRLTMFSCCCSGEAITGGVVVALAVRVIHNTSTRVVELAEQEVQALQAVRDKKHILQYVHHKLTANKQTLLLSTRCITLPVYRDSGVQCVAPQHCSLPCNLMHYSASSLICDCAFNSSHTKGRVHFTAGC